MGTARAIAVLLVVVSIVSGLLLSRELTVRASREALLRDAAAVARGESAAVVPSAVPPLSLPARALVAEAMRRALAADARPDARRLLLDQALALADAAVMRRRLWGEAQLVRAYVLAARDGPRAASTQAALTRSYLEAPYLIDGAAWRVGFGLQHWDALSPSARTRWVEEAIWYSRRKSDVRDPLFAAARGSGAYVPLMLRWREVRARDVDLRRSD